MENEIIMKETEDHIVLEFVSENGNRYAIGYPKAEGYTKEKLEVELKNIDKNLIQSSGNYKLISLKPNGGSEISISAKDIGLVMANVKTNNPTIPYKYTLTFRNNKGWEFRFKDESKDVYKCKTFRNCNHTIWYNSKNPIMIGVK